MKIAEVALTIVFLICVTIRCLEKSATSFRRNNWKRGQKRYFLISSCNIWPPNSQSWYLIWKPSHIWNQGPVWSDTPRNTTVARCTVSKPIREGKWLKEPWLEHQAVIWAKMQEFKLWSLFWFRTHAYTTLCRCMSWNEVFLEGFRHLYHLLSPISLLQHWKLWCSYEGAATYLWVSPQRQM